MSHVTGKKEIRRMRALGVLLLIILLWAITLITRGTKRLVRRILQ